VIDIPLDARNRMSRIDTAPAHHAVERDGLTPRLEPTIERPQPEQPTRVRHVVLLLLILHYANTYVDRVIIAGAAPAIRQELNLTPIMLGVVFSAFNFAYIAFQLPVGWLSDHFGPRRILTAIVSWWCAFTMLTAAAWNVTTLMVLRAVVGAGQSGAFPAATRALSRWLPATERGFAQGITHSASRFAGALTPALVGVMAAAWGWRSAFVILGGVGLLWAVVWYWYYRDMPDNHPRVNAAELAVIHSRSGAKPAQAGAKKPTMPWRVLLRSSNMWLINLQWWGHSYMFWIYITWFPTYLLDHHQFSLAKAGILSAFPLLAGSIANTVGGWASDKLAATHGLKFGRRVVGVVGFAIAVVGTVLGVLVDNPYVAVTLLTTAVFGLELTVGVSWAVTIDVGGDFSGTVSALMNMFGQTGGALSPIIMGALVQWTGRWELAFLIASALCIGSGLLWLKIDPEKSVVT
jgi:sugar phosphate permease